VKNGKQGESPAFFCLVALPYRKPGVKGGGEKPLQGEQPRRITLQAFGSGRAGASFAFAKEKVENGKCRPENEGEIESVINIIHFIKKAIPPLNIYTRSR
jgi:hypothetical protein